MHAYIHTYIWMQCCINTFFKGGKGARLWFQEIRGEGGRASLAWCEWCKTRRFNITNVPLHTQMACKYICIYLFYLIQQRSVSFNLISPAVMGISTYKQWGVWMTKLQNTHSFEWRSHPSPTFYRTEVLECYNEHECGVNWIKMNLYHSIMWAMQLIHRSNENTHEQSHRWNWRSLNAN